VITNIKQKIFYKIFIITFLNNSTNLIELIRPLPLGCCLAFAKRILYMCLMIREVFDCLMRIGPKTLKRKKYLLLADCMLLVRQISMVH